MNHHIDSPVDVAIKPLSPIEVRTRASPVDDSDIDIQVEDDKSDYPSTDIASFDKQVVGENTSHTMDRVITVTSVGSNEDDIGETWQWNGNHLN